MNFNKTEGKVFNKKNHYRIENLPNIEREEDINVVQLNHYPKG